MTEKTMSKLDNIEKIRQLDPDDMYHKIIRIPEQILKAYFELQLKTPKGFSDLQLNKINKVVICGMGGSAISGDIARSAFGTKISFEVVKDYHIPYLDENTLVIVLSYSGNTEETLSCLQQALQSTNFIGAITSGGKVKQLIDGDYCCFNLPSGLPPRSAIGYLFFSLMKILETFKIIPDHTKQVRSVVANLVKKAGTIADSIPEEMNISSKLGKKSRNNR
jgi:glucose/mannose-6-phosphate isomerase